MNRLLLSCFTLASALTLSAVFGCASATPPKDSQTGGGGSGPGGASPLGGSGGSDDAEACQFGNDNTKCGGSPDLICEPLLNGTGKSCAKGADCTDSALCLEVEAGERGCYEISGACTERCSSDAACPGAGDAAEATFCNPRSGLCEAVAIEGASFGETCSPESDECRGNCAKVGDAYECEELCRIGASAGCGQSELAGSGVACAFFAYDGSALGAEQGVGDTGICAKLCDCNDDCPGAQRCLEFPTGESAGVCAGGIAEEDSIVCEHSGAGGAGGAPQ